MKAIEQKVAGQEIERVEVEVRPPTTDLVATLKASLERKGLAKASTAKSEQEPVPVKRTAHQLEEMAGKQLQTFKEMVPTLARLAVVHNPNNPASHVRNEAAAASRLGIKIIPVVFRAPDDLSPAFMTIAQERADAVLLHIASPIGEHWPQFIEFARRQRLPTAGSQRRFALLGGLMHYGPSTSDLLRRAASYVDRILRGAKPGELPVEQPTKFELVINLKTARALGLTIPPSVLARADEVIE